MIQRQFFDKDSSTFTYLLADPLTKEGVIIDSVKENLARDLQLINQLGIKLVYTLETHIHADHITASKELRQRTGAKTVVPWTAQVPCADILLKDGDTLRFGQETITAIYTPGHTNTCMSYLVGDRLFTGDALLIRGTGRTDFQSGSATELYNSIKNKLYTLPDQVLVFPGHDYKGMTQTSIGEEKLFNPRINNETTQAEFVTTMQNLKLADPKNIHEAVPANLQCGTIKETPIKPSKDALYIDVRSLDEYRSGSIPGAICIPHDQIAQQVSQVPNDKPVVLYCRSGKRSAKAKEELNKLGYDNISEIEGGFMAWQSSGNPVFKARKAISIQRQVMIVAGFLGFLGTALGYLVRPEYYALSAFLGAGLMFAGISGFCGMALLLEKMPWNQINDESCSEPSCAGSCSV